MEQITAGARTDDEQLQAFFEVISETVALPCRAYVIDVPVSARSVVYDGNPRRGLLVGCRREDGSDHLVSAAEVFLEADRVGAQLFDVFRRWSGREVPREKNPWHRPQPAAPGPRPASA